jgi:hypothetical protein
MNIAERRGGRESSGERMAEKDNAETLRFAPGVRRREKLRN